VVRSTALDPDSSMSAAQEGTLHSGRHRPHRSRRSRDRRCRGVRHDAQPPPQFRAGGCSRNLAAGDGLSAPAAGLSVGSAAVPANSPPGPRRSSWTGPPVSEPLHPAPPAPGPASRSVNSSARGLSAPPGRAALPNEGGYTASMGRVMPCDCEDHKLSCDSRGRQKVGEWLELSPAATWVAGQLRCGLFQ